MYNQEFRIFLNIPSENKGYKQLIYLAHYSIIIIMIDLENILTKLD